MQLTGRSFSSPLIAGIAVLAAMFGGCAAPIPPLPPLLKDVTAGGGWWGACPAESAEEARSREGRPMALSPELQERLAQAFPPGSEEVRLLGYLRQQGFDLLSPCNSDRSVRVAAFSQHGGGPLSYPLIANVYWKVDEKGKIAWTRGFIRFTAL
jgi:hypothetical protein